MRRGALSRVMVAALALAMAVTIASPGATEAEAATVTDGFDPGMIISDALFYDSRAMTSAEIQTFLNARVPVCKDEDLTNDITCLKDFRADTYAISADAYCDALPARTGQSAAQIIDLVARACGVSQKVILVTLQKEQGLVTHTDPGARRYEIAMGYACPDSAPCDPSKGGFYRQIYLAAWQFQRYRANPGAYRHIAGQNNYVLYQDPNVNPACGSLTVYIRNQATAGLYNYTPYTPNSAALKAGWGTGDSCSSYGNRNFYNYYTTWFGPTAGYPVDSRFDAAYEAYGEEVLGAAVTQAVAVSANGGGWYQRFTNGILYRTTEGVVTYVRPGAFADAYAAAGGPAGSWGWPVSDVTWWKGMWVIDFQETRLAFVSSTVMVGHPFADVSGNGYSHHYNRLAEEIFWMASSGLATGTTTADGTFYQPSSTVKRGAVAAFLYRLAAPDYAAPAEPTFVDVDGSTQFSTEIEWLAEMGIATGKATPAGVEFQPSSEVKRDAMAAFLYRLAAPTDYDAPRTSPFIDVATSDKFYAEICWLAEMGIATGKATPAGVEFQPSSTVKRDAIAAFLARFDQLGP